MRNALVLAILILGLVGCRSSSEPRQSTGPIVFFDAAGNRMMVDSRAIAAAPGATDTAPVAPEPSSPEDIAAKLPATAFQGEKYVDAGDFERTLDEREGQRFFVVPDGSGRRQTLEAGAIGAGMGGGPPVVEPPGPTLWQVCRVILPLLALKPAKRYDVAFPVTDKDDVVYAGYLLPPVPDATRATVQAYVRKDKRAFPVLARVDDKGRVVAIVNNMPTQSIPESGFRYASVGGVVSVSPAGVGGQYALLDGARLTGRLPPACGLQSIPAEAPAASATGLVTLQFSGPGEQ